MFSKTPDAFEFPESPQTVPMYMPECWINEGTNDLIVLDIYGNKPDQLKLTRYQAFAVRPPSPKS